MWPFPHYACSLFQNSATCRLTCQVHVWNLSGIFTKERKHTQAVPWYRTFWFLLLQFSNLQTHSTGDREAEQAWSLALIEEDGRLLIPVSLSDQRQKQRDKPDRITLESSLRFHEGVWGVTVSVPWGDLFLSVGSNLAGKTVSLSLCPHHSFSFSVSLWVCWKPQVPVAITPTCCLTLFVMGFIFLSISLMTDTVRDSKPFNETLEIHGSCFTSVSFTQSFLFYSSNSANHFSSTDSLKSLFFCDKSGNYEKVWLLLQENNQKTIKFMPFDLFWVKLQSCLVLIKFGWESSGISSLHFFWTKKWPY